MAFLPRKRAVCAWCGALSWDQGKGKLSTDTRACEGAYKDFIHQRKHTSATTARDLAESIGKRYGIMPGSRRAS